MSATYPTSLPCRFEGFPPLLKVVCGPLVPTPFSLGSRVVLRRTPLCGLAQGELAVGHPLPEQAMIYADTGSDDSFGLKLSFYGWGTFYVAGPNDAYCTLEIRKGIKVEAAGLNKKFEARDVWETRIPTGTVLTAPPAANVVVGRVEGTTGKGSVGIVTGFDMESGPNGGLRLRGTLQLGGDGCLWDPNG